MARYTGGTCSICNQKFTDTDDIVVCPDCGTPYHRACWKKAGACVHAAEHTAGYTWQSDVPEEAPADTQETVCANCGAHNRPGATFCTHCGVPLQSAPHEGAKTDASATAGSNGPIYGRRTAPHSDAPRPRMETYVAGEDGSIYRREIGPDDSIDGIKARDWASYIGRSSLYYLMQFFRMSGSKSKIAACFSAFLFGPAYLFYRKMWKEGIVTGILYLAMQVPYLLELILMYNPNFLGTTSLGWLSVLDTVCTIGSWAMRVVLMLFAVHWYKKDSAKRILSIYDQIPEGSERSDALVMSGGTSAIAVVLCLLVYYVFVLGFFGLAGPGIFPWFLSLYGL